MGFFRRLRALRRTGRELGAQSGAGATSRRGRLGMLGDLENAVSQIQQSQEDAQRLTDSGLDGIGIVRAMGTPARGSLMFNLEIDLEVHVEGLSPYRVASQYLVSRNHHIAVGVELPIRVDQQDPARIAIDWANAPQRPRHGAIRPVEE